MDDKTYFINYMEHSHTREADSRSGGYEIPRFLRKTKVYYRVHKSQPSDLVSFHLDPIDTLTHYFFKINFNIILLSRP
jgi:hypothetical protein